MLLPSRTYIREEADSSKVWMLPSPLYEAFLFKICENFQTYTKVKDITHPHKPKAGLHDQDSTTTWQPSPEPEGVRPGPFHSGAGSLHTHTDGPGKIRSKGPQLNPVHTH